jgi:type I restriction enzyme M protein
MEHRQPARGREPVLSPSKEQGEGQITAGRAAVVVPNGTLFGDGICARIKEELLKDFNLHTIVRLPEGVFSPYTGIPTNVIFFDRSQPTGEVWYYEIPARDGKRYSKSKPMQFDEFSACVAWWKTRRENEHCWRVNASELLGNGCNLDFRNPNSKLDVNHLPPDRLIQDILDKQLKILSVVQEIQSLLQVKQ